MEMSPDIETLYREGTPFAIYRFPGESKLHTVVRGQGHFRIVPWLAESTDAIDVASVSDGNDLCEPWNYSTPLSNYISTTQSLIERLRRRGGKCVRMRTISCGGIRLDINRAVADLFARFPDAFCHCYYTPSTGMWIGATPELLACVNGNELRTMSLAGTRPASCTGGWDRKNIMEQRMVTDFITESLKSFSDEIKVSQAGTLRYGDIEHLCTHISARIDASETCTVLDALSPTPAVAGMPRDIAIKEIEDTEDAPRRCYAGYISIIAPDGSMHAYVNLRCAHISPQGWCIYAGGGITPESRPADEWNETEAKASVLHGILLHNSLSLE